MPTDPATRKREERAAAQSTYPKPSPLSETGEREQAAVEAVVPIIDEIAAIAADGKLDERDCLADAKFIVSKVRDALEEPAGGERSAFAAQRDTGTTADRASEDAPAQDAHPPADLSGEQSHDGLRVTLARFQYTSGDWSSWTNIRPSLASARREEGWEVVEVMPVAECVEESYKAATELSSEREKRKRREWALALSVCDGTDPPVYPAFGADVLIDAGYLALEDSGQVVSRADAVDGDYDLVVTETGREFMEREAGDVLASLAAGEPFATIDEDEFEAARNDPKRAEVMAAADRYHARPVQVDDDRPERYRFVHDQSLGIFAEFADDGFVYAPKPFLMPREAMERVVALWSRPVDREALVERLASGLLTTLSCAQEVHPGRPARKLCTIAEERYQELYALVGEARDALAGVAPAGLPVDAQSEGADGKTLTVTAHNAVGKPLEMTGPEVDRALADLRATRDDLRVCIDAIHEAFGKPEGGIIEAAKRLRGERDEARAEAERLQGHLAKFHDLVRDGDRGIDALRDYIAKLEQGDERGVLAAKIEDGIDALANLGELSSEDERVTRKWLAENAPRIIAAAQRAGVAAVPLSTEVLRQPPLDLCVKADSAVSGPFGFVTPARATRARQAVFAVLIDWADAQHSPSSLDEKGESDAEASRRYRQRLGVLGRALSEIRDRPSVSWSSRTAIQEHAANALREIGDSHLAEVPAVGLTVEGAKTIRETHTCLSLIADGAINAPLMAEVAAEALRETFESSAVSGGPEPAATDCHVAVKPACGCWVGLVADGAPESARDLTLKQWEADGLVPERTTVERARERLRECPHGLAATEGEETGNGDA